MVECQAAIEVIGGREVSSPQALTQVLAFTVRIQLDQGRPRGLVDGQTSTLKSNHRQARNSNTRFSIA